MKKIILTIVFLTLFGCAQGEREIVKNPQNILENKAMVNDIDILILESFPVQVNVVITGDLRNGCEQIDDIFIERENGDFKITVLTVEEGEMCTMALVPFNKTVGLEVLNLKAGEYNVEVNGINKTFTLNTDNTLKP